MEAQAPQETTTEKPDEIGADMALVRGEVDGIRAIQAQIDQLAKDHPDDLVIQDIQTPAGLRAAKEARAAWRTPRVAVENARKAAKAPLLALGRAIDGFAAGLETRLRKGETNYDGQIKAEEARRESVRAAEEAAEAARRAEQKRRMDALIAECADAEDYDSTAMESFIERLTVRIEEFQSAESAEWGDMAGQALIIMQRELRALESLVKQVRAREQLAAQLAAMKEQAAQLEALQKQAAYQQIVEQARSAAAAESQEQAPAAQPIKEEGAAPDPVAEIKNVDHQEEAPEESAAPELFAPPEFEEAAAPAAVEPQPAITAEDLSVPIPGAPALGLPIPPVPGEDLLTITKISSMIGVAISSETIASLGFQPDMAIKNGKFYTKDTVVKIINALISHLASVRNSLASK